MGEVVRKGGVVLTEEQEAELLRLEKRHAEMIKLSQVVRLMKDEKGAQFIESKARMVHDQIDMMKVGRYR